MNETLTIKMRMEWKNKADQMSADEITEMGRKAKKRVAEEYTWDKICGQYEDVFTNREN